MSPTPICPHGDETCPCQDGDSCHYEGSDPFECSNRPFEPYDETITLDDGTQMPVRFELHCHVEGCRWERELCGLARLRVPAPDVAFPGSPHWACGAWRAVEAMYQEDPSLREALGG